MKDQHEKIKGYRDLSAEEIQAMNDVKGLEGQLREFIKNLQGSQSWPNDSGRWFSLAKTNLETGFMYLVKAIARPTGQMGSDVD